jgi:hypothetical protein
MRKWNRKAHHRPRSERCRHEMMGKKKKKKGKEKKRKKGTGNAPKA